MMLSRQELDDRLFGVLNKHLGHEVPKTALRLLNDLFTSTMLAARENRIGRSFESEKKLAVKQLDNVAKHLGQASNHMQKLNPLAQELLAREKIGLLDLSSGELEKFFWAGTQVGQPGTVENWIRQLDDLCQSVERVRGELEGKLKRFGRGAPHKHGPLTVAQICVLAFQEYVGQPSKPTWNNYSDEYEGQFYCFVRDVFMAGELKADAVEFTKQAIETVEKK